jgi:hypothetical protein
LTRTFFNARFFFTAAKNTKAEVEVVGSLVPLQGVKTVRIPFNTIKKTGNRPDFIQFSSKLTFAGTENKTSEVTQLMKNCDV